MDEQKLQIGSMVHYVMPDGQLRPAICVRAWSETMGNFQVFTDGSNDKTVTFYAESNAYNGTMWATSVSKAGPAECGTYPARTWHWAE